MRIVKSVSVMVMLCGGPVIAHAQVRGAIRPPAVRPTAPVATPSAARPTTVSPTRASPVSASSASAPAGTTAVGPKPSATGNRPATVPRVSGNSLSSNKPQHLYGIFATDTNTGKTSLYKYGVSGGKTKTSSQLPPSMQRSTTAASRDYSNRALTQVQLLNKQAQANGQSVKYSTRTLQRIPAQSSMSPTARQAVIAAEKQAVTKYAVKNAEKLPTGNTLPKPYAYSRTK